MNLRKDQSGQGMTEYIIIVALIAVAGIAAFTYFGRAVRSQTDAMTQEIAGADGTSAQSHATDAGTSAQTDAGESKTLSNYTGESKE